MEEKGELTFDKNDLKDWTPRSDGEIMEISTNTDYDSSKKTHSPSSSLMKGNHLDLSFQSLTKESSLDYNNAAGEKAYSKDFSRENIQEDSLLVNFELPDGSYGESSFKKGHTVEYLKSFVESEYGIPMLEQIMYIEEKMMMNPLSLVDFKEAKEMDEILIRVEGPLPSVRK